MHRARIKLYCMVLMTVLGSAGISTWADSEQASLSSVTDCRYLTTENPGFAFDADHLGEVWFPEGDLFRPILADMRQPRLYLSGRTVKFNGDAFPTGSASNRIQAGIVGIGSEFGIWRKSARRRCNGVQVNLLGAITSQFNLDASSDALVNTDFIIGPEVNLRRGRFSARFRIFHQSSHLGDEFLLQNPGFDRINLSFEVVDGTLSYEGPWWRVYGGAGYLTGAEPKLDPWFTTWGFELRSPKRRWGAMFTPVFGADFNALEARDWAVTTSLMGGIEMSNLTGTRRYRVLLAWLKGFIPFGQFFNTARIKNFGFHLEFDW